jgi:hypothetical protein
MEKPPFYKGEEPKRDCLRARFSRLLHYWFIQYNPLYFFSALCILFGVFLVSRGLREVEWEKGQILLTAVMQVYEIFLITGSAILFRKAGQFRPAVILGLLQVFFIFDCTLRTETMVTAGLVGRIITVAWIAMVPLKLIALAWIFRLKSTAPIVFVATLMAYGFAGIPHAFNASQIDRQLIHLAATWYGILMTLLLWSQRKARCDILLDAWVHTVFQRSLRATFCIWTGFYFFHLMIWSGMFSIPLMVSHLAPFLLLFFLSRKEVLWWISIFAAVALTFAEPAAVALSAFMVALISGIQAWNTKKYRLFVGTVLAWYLSIWTFGWRAWPLPEPNMVLMILTMMMLTVLAWKFRLSSPLLAVILVLIPAIRLFIPRTVLEWGILTLFVGFIALIVGVAINWRLRQTGNT